MAEVFRQARTAAALTEPAGLRIERLHRVYLARQLCRGRDVLDLAAGDGSGAAVLAQVARSVLALAPDAAARDAAAAAFPSPSLRFALTSEWQQIEPASRDLIVAFGVLERQADHDRWLARLRTLLRPGGRILIAAEDADAASDPTLDPHEPGRRLLNGGQLRALAGRHFAHALLFGQQGLIGSAMVGSGGGLPLVLEHRGHLLVEAGSGLRRAPALLCIASDQPLDDVPDSLFLDSDLAALAEAQDRALHAASERDALREQHVALAAQAARQRRSDAEWRHELAVLRVNEAAAIAAAETARARLEAGERQMLVTLTAQAETNQRYLATLEGVQARERRTAEEVLRLQVRQPVGMAVRLRRRLALLRSGGASARIRAVRASTAFDAGWYRGRNGDVAHAGADPATHYVRSGAAEGRDPGPDFDAGWYAAQHPELEVRAQSPVEHFEAHGRAAGWATAPARHHPNDDTPPPPPEPPGAAVPAPIERAPVPANPHILYVSGESATPGNQYRCVRYAEAARQAGWTAGWRSLETTGATELAGVRIVVLWRVRYSDHVAGIMREIRTQGGLVVFDVDDLMIKPDLAATRLIDGIRTTNAGIASTRATFAQVQQTMAEADLCTAPTEELAAHMREWQKPAYVLPNGFDAATHRAARLAVRVRAAGPSDHLIRIGYAAGTVTHQKDFAVVLPALLRVLAARPAVRLILFRTAGTELVVVDEFDDLARQADRIEWRDTVTLDALPTEMARFDINIAPLETGNPFCEAKSELKYFEAALAGVPTVASPTGPFARAIVHGLTGLLASDDEAWFESLLRLIDDPEQRRAIGRRAYHDCLWRFGPERRTELVRSFLDQLAGGGAGARAFALDLAAARDHQARRGEHVGDPPPTETVFRHDSLHQALVTVIVPCFNYAEFIVEALESVRAQTLDPIDLVVVDDCSTDPLTAELIGEWARRHASRFNRLLVLRHEINAGLGAARNTGFAAAETPYVLPLDADNRLRPTCCERLLETLRASDAAYAYASLRMFGAADGLFCIERYQPQRFVAGNYIDAMALVAKSAWAAASGYHSTRELMGWEDFDFWCRLAELARHGVHVNEVLADYRVHGASMIAELIEQDVRKQGMVTLIEQRHDWLRVLSRRPRDRI